MQTTSRHRPDHLAANLQHLRKAAGLTQQKLADIAVYCDMGTRAESAPELARKLIDRVWALNDEIGIPRTTDLIRAEDIDELVKAALAEGGTYPLPRFLSKAECRGVIEAISA